MWRLLTVIALAAMALTVLPVGEVAWAANGGGAGDAGTSIWAATWWAGSPAGPGVYIPPASGAATSVCAWRDVGPTLADVDDALGGADLPASFWEPTNSGGHPGIFQFDEWGAGLAAAATTSDHFDLVACPEQALVPTAGPDVYSSFPEATGPAGSPVFLWVFWDTVPDPSAGGPLPPVIGEAFDEVELPAPRPRARPYGVGGIGRATVVGLPTAFWVARGVWRVLSAEASGGGLTAVVWATPEEVTWTAYWDDSVPADDPEHGVTFGPERLALSCGFPRALSPGSCEATFRQSSLGALETVRVGLVWSIDWALVGPSGVVGGEGTLPSLITRASLPLRVLQVESVLVGG